MRNNNSRQSIGSIRKSILHTKRRWPICFTILIGLVVATAAYFALGQSGFSEEHLFICGLEEHKHEQKCFFEPELICPLEESRGHAHKDSCYGNDWDLICDISETLRHSHGDNCYYVELELICEKQETKGTEETEPYRHSEGCYRPALVCGFDEHKHISLCRPLMSIGNNSLVQPSNNEEAAGLMKLSSEEEAAEPGSVEAGNEATETQLIESKRDAVAESRPVSRRDEGEAESGEVELEETEVPGEEAVAEENGEASEVEVVVEGEEETVEEPIEEEESLEFGMFEFRPFGVESRVLDAPVAIVEVPVTKYIVGGGALNDSVFDENKGIVIQLTDTSGVVLDEITMKKDMFIEGKCSVVFAISIPEYETIYSYKIQEKQLAENNMWEFDESVYSFSIIANYVDGKVTVTVSESSGSTIQGVNQKTSTQIQVPRTQNYTYTPFVTPFVLAPGTMKATKYRLSYNNAGFDEFIIYLGEGIDEALLADDYDASQYVDDTNHILALCADIDIPEPSGTTLYEYAASRDNTESALAYSLYAESVGAKMSMGQFNQLFGFGLDGNPDKIEDKNLRKVLMQYALWYYEKKNVAGYAEYWKIDELKKVSLQHNLNALYRIPGSIPNVYRYRQFYYDFLDHTNIHSASAVYEVQNDFALTEDIYGNHLIHIIRTIDNIMSFYNKGTDIVVDGETMLELLYEAGELSINYKSKNAVKPSHKLELSWTGSAEVTVNGNDVADGITSVMVNYDDEILVSKLGEDVVFTIIDPINYLVQKSIKGSLLSQVDGAVGGHKSNQALITGVSEFIQLTASVSVNEYELKFTNYFFSYELPRTIGLGLNKFLITGAILTLASAAVLFTKGVRPIREGMQDSKARLLSLVGRRTGRNRRRGRKRE